MAPPCASSWLLLAALLPLSEAFAPSLGARALPQRHGFASAPKTAALAPSLRRPVSGLAGLDMKLGALLFACDGVLVDSDSDGHRTALNMAMSELKLDIQCSEEQYGKLLHMRDVQRIEQFWKEVGWKDMTVETALKVYEKKSEIFQRLVSEGKIPVRKGVEKLMDEAIAAGIPVAVCSSNTHAAVAEVVASLGTAKADKVSVFAGDDVVRRKPFPDVYQLAQIKLGVSPEDCVVVEDNQVGLDAAKAAGMLCIITKSKYTKDDVFPKADLVVDDLEAGDIDLEAVAGMAFNMQGLNA